MITEIAFIAYPSTNMDRSKSFYEGVLGLKPTMESKKDTFAWTEYDIGATTFGVGQSSEWKPSSDGATVSFEVDDFPKTIADLKEKGISFAMEPFETQVCHMALICDPDGNKVMIHKRKPGQS